MDTTTRAIVDLIDALKQSTKHEATVATLDEIKKQVAAQGREIVRVHAGMGELEKLANEGMPRSSAIAAARDRLADLTACPPEERSDTLAALEHANQWIEAVSEFEE